MEKFPPLCTQTNFYANLYWRFPVIAIKLDNFVVEQKYNQEELRRWKDWILKGYYKVHQISCHENLRFLWQGGLSAGYGDTNLYLLLGRRSQDWPRFLRWTREIKFYSFLSCHATLYSIWFNRIYMFQRGVSTFNDTRKSKKVTIELCYLVIRWSERVVLYKGDDPVLASIWGTLWLVGCESWGVIINLLCDIFIPGATHGGQICGMQFQIWPL